MCRLFLCEIIKGFRHYARILIFLSWFWELFWEFLQVQLLFLAIFLAFGLNLGCCFKRFRDYSSPRSAYYAINPL